MEECDNRVNIETSLSADQTVLKRKLDANSDELSFPCKKVVMAPIPKVPSQGATTTPTAANTMIEIQAKLTKAEREWLKMEKAKGREAERLKREEERGKREEERQKREKERREREEERFRKVYTPSFGVNDAASRKRRGETEERCRKGGG